MSGELPLAGIQAQTGLRLQVLRALPGGEQGGAHLVAAGADRTLVLKLQADRHKAERLLRAVPVVDHAVRHGWPAAAWVQAGRLHDGTAFVLQEYVPGRPITAIDAHTMTAIVEANARQSGLATAEATDDSRQLQSVVRDHPWRALVRGHSPAGAALVRHGDDAIRRAGPVRLPVTDLVHGDYSTSNMILTGEGAVRFVDCETVGRGTRVRDLADLYRQCFMYPGTPAAARQILRDHATAIAGPAVFATCAVAVSYNNLAWWVENRSPAEFDEACRRVHRLFDDVGGAIA
jgi:aminoglycoside phosphotransferase (APT) family kinase protein